MANKNVKQFNTAITLGVVGIIITAFSWWLFGGFGFWAIPGTAIIFAGLAAACYTIAEERLAHPNSVLKGGLFAIWIAIASFLGFMQHAILGTFQLLSLAIIIIGAIITAIGFIKAT